MARPEKEPKTPLARRLREVRRTLGVDNREVFAQSLGISKDALAMYERGDNVPAATTLAVYGDLYGVDMNWLLNERGEMFVDSGPAPLSINTEFQAEAMRAISQAMGSVYKQVGVRLPVDALGAEMVRHFDAVLRRMEDPTSLAEFRSLVSWLENRIRQELLEAANSPGTGKRAAS